MIKLRNTINKMYKSKTRTNLLLPFELTTTKQKQKKSTKVWGKLNLNPSACDVHLRKCKIRLQKNTLTNDYSLRLLMKIKILGKPYIQHDKINKLIKKKKKNSEHIFLNSQKYLLKKKCYTIASLHKFDARFLHTWIHHMVSRIP